MDKGTINYYTYALLSEKNNRLYVGQTNNIRERMKQHNLGLVKSTKPYMPWRLIYFEKFDSRAKAMQREKELKSHQGRIFLRNISLSGRVRQLPD